MTMVVMTMVVMVVMVVIVVVVVMVVMMDTIVDFVLLNRIPLVAAFLRDEVVGSIVPGQAFVYDFRMFFD